MTFFSRCSGCALLMAAGLVSAAEAPLPATRTPRSLTEPAPAPCPLRGRPRLLNTTRPVTPVAGEARGVTWDPVTRTLSGVCDAAAGESYELLIPTHTAATARAVAALSASVTGPNGYELAIAPGEGQVTRPDDAYAHANTPDAPRTTLFEPQTEEGLVRLVFISGSGGQVIWRVTFAERAVSVLTPSAPCR